MTIVLPKGHHIRQALQSNGVECISQRSAIHQDIRPLRIGILNIMPRAEQYEFNLLLPLGRSLLQIHPVWIRLESHTYSSTPADHLSQYYQSFEKAIETPLDGLIVTGAPVEEKAFENVQYWPEIQQILNYAQPEICSTLGICWGGLALAKHLDIEKIQLTQKLFGVFPLRNLKPDHPIMGGLDDIFWCPQSRHAGIDDATLETAQREQRVTLLAHGEGVGYAIFESPDHRFLMHLGHHEYNSQRLIQEAIRDSEQGRTDVGPLQNIDMEHPRNTWRANRNEFFGGWIRYIYQSVSRQKSHHSLSAVATGCDYIG